MGRPRAPKKGDASVKPTWIRIGNNGDCIMNLSEPIVAELKIEAGTTRRMLERVPQDALLWKPHEKSRTLGELAAHIAHLPGLFIATLDQDKFDRHAYESVVDTVADILETFDKNISDALEVLPTLSDERLLASWRYEHGDRVIFEMPRLVVIRTTALNHLIHHRGQLSLYLRLLNVPLPSVYGPTADESGS
jgi:uncharacterized damage-inducible protein DinB